MYKNILHATDLSETHFEICEKAAKIAKLLKGNLYLIHVIELPAGVQLAQGLGFTELAAPSTDDAWTVMRVLGETLRIPKKRQFVEIGSISEHIINKIQELHCDLLILGSHDAHTITSLFGSTSSAMLLHPPCDVITLKP